MTEHLAMKESFQDAHFLTFASENALLLIAWSNYKQIFFSIPD
ncbi:hypothetical protein HCH_00357 [Hahella chejuensis KCTC 2396]|uniref:Uncharacterized protein n=1 Tax=Hahella chejuensis (strain KCTC 2396) TaxID=349521 RepID=Q2SQ05_HAHCH|nr:hypothetical protein HCH_00357 [Hahella chejuensis KCTC 2396]